MCECISCRSGLFAYLARAPFHFSNSYHAPTLNLPPTPTIARFFFTNDLFGPLYLGIIGSKKLLFIIDLASHRIVSFPLPFHCELNCELPPSCWPLLIYYHAICYLFSRSTEALAISQQNEAAKGAFSKGCLLSWFTTIWIMIQLNFNQKSMNCQYNAHTHTWKHTHIYTGMHTCPVCRICGTV